MRRWLYAIVIGVGISLLFLLSGESIRGATTPPLTPTSADALLRQDYQAGKLNLDQWLLYYGYSLAAPEKLPARYQNRVPGLDGTPFFIILRQKWTLLQPKTRKALAQLGLAPVYSGDQQRPILSGPEEQYQTTHFLIHYTRSGKDAVPTKDANGDGVPDYVAEAASVAEFVRQTEIDTLKWAQPPADHGEGGDQRYDIYFRDIPYYGYTQASEPIGDNPHTSAVETAAAYSFLVLDNDYAGFDGTPLLNLKVTIAHEFNHAIQYGYDSSEPEIWLYESVAVWMESEVYPQIHDNWRYLSAWYTVPDRCLPYYSAQNSHVYGDWLFIRYLSERDGGNATVRRIWEHAVQLNGLAAVSASLTDAGYNLGDAYAAFTVAALLENKCPAGQPYCFRDAPFSFEGSDIAAKQEGIITYDGTAGSRSSANGVQPYGVDYWQLRSTSQKAMSLTITFPSPQPQHNYRPLLVAADGNGIVHVTRFPVVNGQGSVHVDPAEYGLTHYLAIVDEAMVTQNSCSYEPYTISWQPTAAYTPTPTPSPTPTATATYTPTPTWTPTVTPTPTPGPTRTPVTVCRDLLQNGDFESGETAPWHSSASSLISPVAAEPPSAYGAWLGGYYNAYDWLYQDLNLPLNSGVRRLVLQYDWYVNSQLPRGQTPQHTLEIDLFRTTDQTRLAQLGWQNDQNPLNVWQHTALDITQYAGQRVRLQFTGRTNDTSAITSFFVDNVHLLACRQFIPNHFVYLPLLKH